ncbi:unnamed protein product [Caenorhabditis nigoni]|uniref:Uncharacterized protein n=1 Tax=Caenorhabditis nigoni TaxID=1611254 RepID=A0A2G5SLI8_9PELO|nr:hypothetical protein B9Z55_022632 [Caenorhabditis nigoni]
MPFPTLSDLAAKAIAQSIQNETLSLDFPLDTKSSNNIAREILALGGDSFKYLKVYKNQLSVSKIDFTCCNVDAEGVRNLINFNLDSLDLGEMIQLKNNWPDKSHEDSIDIVSLLTQSLNDCSRRSMIHLSLDYQEFSEGWEKELSQMLPHLRSIHIRSTVFNQRLQFSNFCACFPDLLALDISCAYYLSGLQGIKNIENLQKLSMSYVDIMDINGYKELSELKNLKYLNVSGTNLTAHTNGTNSIRKLLAAEVRMEALEFLDCSWTSVTEHELRIFAKNHPSLNTIAAICTSCNQTAIPGIKMLNASSLSSLPACFEYLLSINQFDEVIELIEEIFNSLGYIPGNLANSELNHITNAVIFVLRESVGETTNLNTLMYYLESGLFEHELATSWFSTHIPEMIEFFYDVFDAVESTEFKEVFVEIIFGMLETIVKSVSPGILIPDRVLCFVFEKTVNLVNQFPEYQNQGKEIIYQAVNWMSCDQFRKFSENSQLVRKVYEFINSA